MFPSLPATVASFDDLDPAQVEAAIGMNDAILPLANTTEPFTAMSGTIAKLTSDADELAKSETSFPVAIDDWSGAISTRSVEADMANNIEMSMTTVVNYTDIDDPTGQAYSVYYSTANRTGVSGTADADDGALTIESNGVAGNHMQISVNTGQ